MSKLGVLGGTFDPVHLGHLRAAEVARDALALDRVLFVPASNPPHKEEHTVTSADERVAMLERALSSVDAFEVSRVEIERGGPSYTIDTLAELEAAHPDAELSFITGSDAFLEIETWKDWQSLLERYTFVVHERPGTDTASAGEVVSAPLRERIVWLTRDLLNVSSTDVRRSARAGESIRFLVPDEVADYIRRHRLYE